MTDPTEAAVEAEINDKGLDAPRVTPDMLDAEIAGESACASPENFDEALGRNKIARGNARDKMWPLLGFRLRDQLAGSGQ